MGINRAIQAKRKPEILEAALRVIARDGFQNTTLDTVAKEAGRSKGGIVHYFPTKDEIIQAAVVAFYDRIFERGKATRDQFDDPLDRILSFEWLLNHDDPDAYVGYRLSFDFMCLAAQKDEYAKLYGNWVKGWLFFVEEDIKAGIRNGQFQVMDVEGTARLISAIYEGISHRWYLDPDHHSTEWAKISLRKSITTLLAPVPPT